MVELCSNQVSVTQRGEVLLLTDIFRLLTRSVEQTRVPMTLVVQTSARFGKYCL